MDSVLNHSSSERSCSPPASRISTRHTTPEFDSSTSRAASGIGSMRICDMDNPNSFQTRDHRHSGEMSPAIFRRFNQQHHQQQHHPQQHQQVPMRHVLANAIAPRSVDAPNWRMSMGMSAGQSHGLGHSHGHYHTLSSTSGPEYMAMGSSATQSRGAAETARDNVGVDTTGFFAYCLDRGNGNYTRLIPADCLQPLVGIPAVQHGADGMLVLPTPRGLDHQNLQGGTIQPIAFKTPPPSPAPVSDALQKRIDQIIASSPAPPKKPKIYCDKWVHEGVCAFTQQGCKYKHEMPLDKATQHSLGLFHGLPTWWKKQQTELQRQQQQQEGSGSEVLFDTRPAQQGALPSPTRSDKDFPSPARASQSWRRIDGVKTHGQMGSMSSSRQGGGGGYRTSAEARSAYQQKVDSPTSPCVWGPIGPPSKQASEPGRMYHQNLGDFGASSNFAMLSSLEDSMGAGCAGSRFDHV